MKRTFDFTCASLALIVLSPMLLIIWLCIVVTSGLPGFFKQQRVGLNGMEFTLLKFRTMTVNKSSEAGTFDAGSTARVTRIGRFLRKTKLDELPQLWNVVKGDMSIIGPRPEVRKWVEIYPDRWKKVLSVRPGITDNASIIFRNEEELLAESETPEKTYKEEILPKKLDLYEKYVDNNSFLIDLNIIFRTIIAILHN